jgi:archaellum biogenesis ATPase FlaH
MHTMDAQGVLRSALMRRPGTKKAGTKLTFRCLRHEDRTASAWLGDHAWGCSACGFTEPLPTLAEALGVTLPVAATAATGLTLEAYGERKGLRLDLLQQWGCRTVQDTYGPVVEIPYYAADGTLLRTKVRTPRGTFWRKDGSGTPLYGLDRLAQSPPDAPVLVVEGESDCHAAWQRGLVAVGLPGANAWKPQYAEALRGRRVLLWQEPDVGGATLVASVSKQIPDAIVLRDVRVADVLVKDVCDLHQVVQSEGLDWATVWGGIVQAATPAQAEPPHMAFDALVGDTLDALAAEKQQPIDAVPTPLPAWNGLCRGAGGGIGLARGWLVTVGANTGTGKSLMALNLAAEAIRHGEIVTFLSLEMGRSELATRFLAMAANIPVALLEQGPGFSASAYARAAERLNTIRAETGGYLQVNRRPLSKLAELVQCMQHHHDTTGSRYFLVDYLQLAWTQAGHSVTERIELVAHQLRELTQRLNVVLVALSQFNRQTSANRAERPVAQGLMGGSPIENDSHQVLLLDHSRWERRGSVADTWLLCDKNRHGSVQDIPIRWDFDTLRLLPRVPTVEEAERLHGRAPNLMGRLR